MIKKENDKNYDENSVSNVGNFMDNLRKNIVYFKKISPTFEDNNYVIVPKTTNENNQVEMYDSIIVKGRNLYDGKYL